MIEKPELLNAKEPPNTDNDGCKSRLHIAAENGKLQLVKKLVEHGEDINKKNNEDWIPLHCALFEDHVKTAEYLIEIGSETNIPDSLGRYPIYYAAGLSAELTETLIEKGADVNCHDEDKKTPLHNAAREGITDAAALLLESGVKYDLKDNEGKTPLYFAAMLGYIEIVKMMVAAGADMHTHSNDSNYNTPLDMAKEYHDLATYNWMLKHSKIDAKELKKKREAYIIKKMFKYCKDGSAGMAKVFISKYDTDINAKDEHGKTLLHYGVELDTWGKEDFIIRMMGYGADPNTLNNEGKSPLDLASDDIKKLMEFRPKLKKKVVELVELLKPNSSAENISNAITLLKSNKNLRLAVDTLELKRIKDSNDERAKELIKKIKDEQHPDIFTSWTCESCGRHTLKRHTIINGYPDSSAANSEVTWKCICASCGKSNIVIV